MSAQHPVIITGGAQRLGLAIAKHLRQQGYPLIVSFRNHRPGVEELHDLGVTTIQADFASDQGIADFIDQIKGRVTGLRGIIHNASDWQAEAATQDHSTLLARMMQIHACAPYQINLALQGLLQQQDNTTDIIHMTDYVQQTGSKKHIAYAASKAALHNLTLSFATLLAPKVKVNSIAPALLMFNQDDSAEYKQAALQKSLLQRCPGAQEAVKAVSYLMTSDFITGQCLHLNGGRHLR